MKRGVLFRLTSIVLAITMALQASAAGLHAVAATLSQEFQAWVRSSSAGMRFPDIGVFDEFGDIIQYIEVKFGKSRYTDSQWIKDELILIERKIPTMLWRVEAF